MCRVRTTNGAVVGLRALYELGAQDWTQTPVDSLVQGPYLTQRIKEMDGYNFINLLHLFKWGLLVAILCPENVRFELRHPDLGYAPHNCNIYKEFKWILGVFTMVPARVLIHPRACKVPPLSRWNFWWPTFGALHIQETNSTSFFCVGWGSRLGPFWSCKQTWGKSQIPKIAPIIPFVNIW
jgi:hypothetical protein